MCASLCTCQRLGTRRRYTEGEGHSLQPPSTPGIGPRSKDVERKGQQKAGHCERVQEVGGTGSRERPMGKLLFPPSNEAGAAQHPHSRWGPAEREATLLSQTRVSGNNEGQESHRWGRRMREPQADALEIFKIYLNVLLPHFAVGMHRREAGAGN